MQKHNEYIALHWTGERYVPERKGNIQLEHLHRYVMACEYVKDKIVLDIACGEGYGSMLLSTFAASVTGVDISEEVIGFAKAKYNKDSINFKTGTCDKIPLEDSSVDVVVSFETIEHHDQHDAMMKEIKRVLKKDGMLIMSSPNKHEYSDIPTYNNPFHKKELYRDEFESLLKDYFNNIIIHGQRVIYGSGIFPEYDKGHTVTFNMEKVVQSDIEQSRSPGIARPLYFIAIASDVELPSEIGSILEQPVTESETFINFSKHFEKQVQELKETLNNLNLTPSQQKQVISGKDRIIANYRDELYSVYISRSWRYTAFLRKIVSVLRIMYLPHIRAIIKRAYFLIPRRIRCSTFIENLKNRFKNAELK